MGNAQPSALAAAPVLLAGIRALFERALDHTRAAVAAAGGDSAALDTCQVQGYEFAMINAELHAAGAIVDYARSCMTTVEGASHGAELEARLAGTFVAESVIKLRGRFEKLRYLCGLDARELARAFDTAEAAALARRYLAPAFLEETGAMVLRDGNHGRS
ncbi:MAG: hypothetical protein RLW62_11595, partial [Gammaproteobacteria bacterium]